MSKGQLIIDRIDTGKNHQKLSIQKLHYKGMRQKFNRKRELVKRFIKNGRIHEEN